MAFAAFVASALERLEEDEHRFLVLWEDHLAYKADMVAKYVKLSTMEDILSIVKVF